MPGEALVTGRICDTQALAHILGNALEQAAHRRIKPANARSCMRYAIAETRSFLLPRVGGSVPYTDRQDDLQLTHIQGEKGSDFARNLSPLAPTGPWFISVRLLSGQRHTLLVSRHAASPRRTFRAGFSDHGGAKGARLY